MSPITCQRRMAKGVVVALAATSPHDNAQPSKTSANKVSKLKRIPTFEQANFYAQELNNSAILCIEIGEYDRAIMSLGKALKFSELCTSENLRDSCLCHNCTLDGCITYSERIAEAISVQRRSKSETSSASSSSSPCGESSTKKRRLASPPAVASSPSPENQHFWTPRSSEAEHLNKNENSDPGYWGSVYRRPIRITPRSILEGHNMGSTLFLIVTFNLALAHHLKSLSMFTTRNQVQQHKQKLLLAANAVKLYELARSWAQRHCERCVEDTEDNEEDDWEGSCRNNQNRSSPHHPDSIRFHMIVCNNLCQLYRSANETTKHRELLSELLTSVMLLVDRKKLIDEQQQQQQNPHRPESVGPLLDLLHRDYCDEDEDSEAPWTGNTSNKDSSRRYHLEEYVQNTAEMVLQRYSADAA